MKEVGVPLTRRELEILELCAQGMTSREISDELCISSHTVKDYRSSAMKKLNASNMVEAVVTALHVGVIEGNPPK